MEGVSSSLDVLRSGDEVSVGEICGGGRAVVVRMYWGSIEVLLEDGRQIE
jgi:hypothetical protein